MEAKNVYPILDSKFQTYWGIDEQKTQVKTIEDYAKDGRQGAVGPLCSFYHDSLRT